MSTLRTYHPRFRGVRRGVARPRSGPRTDHVCQQTFADEWCHGEHACSHPCISLDETACTWRATLLCSAGVRPDDVTDATWVDRVAVDPRGALSRPTNPPIMRPTVSAITTRRTRVARCGAVCIDSRCPPVVAIDRSFRVWMPSYRNSMRRRRTTKAPTSSTVTSRAAATATAEPEAPPMLRDGLNATTVPSLVPT